MHFDVIVIGGGSIGLATAYELGKSNAKTLVLEQYAFLNQKGSSAGQSRQFRIPYPEDYMVHMAVEALPCWRTLESSTGRSLLQTVGTLWFGDPGVHSTEGNIAGAKEALKKEKVAFSPLSSGDVESKFNFTNLPGPYEGLYQADGASIDLALTLELLLKLNRESPSVSLEENSPVLKIDNTPNSPIKVYTKQAVYTCDKLVVTPGPYINNILDMLGFQIAVTYWEMSSAYFKKTDPNIDYPTWFVFQNADGENGNQFYGFPESPWDHPGYIRVCPDFVIKPLDSPDHRTDKPNARELSYTTQWIKSHMKGLDPTPAFTSTCLIALSTLSKKELVLDFAPPKIPNHENIIVYGTGWAAKFIPLLGKILMQLAIKGHTDYNIQPFQLGYKYFRVY
jgi:glycine/D-amino acid oxidase-like deaminating enzyme